MNIKELKKEILEREFKKHGEKKIMLELQIALQSKLPLDEMSAEQVLARAANGVPISTKKIKRSDHIHILEGELNDVNLVLETIGELF